MLDTETPREERQARFFRALLDEVGKMNTGGLPVVLMAHLLSIEGSDRTGHDETVGGIEYVPISSMGEGYDYLALGHIHCPQNIKGNGRHARYCGTPLTRQFRRSLSTLRIYRRIKRTGSATDKGNRNRKSIPLVTLPKEPVVFEEAIKLLEEYPDDKPAYIRLNVLIKDYLAPDCNERASNAVRGKSCKYCYIKSNREKQTSDYIARHISIQKCRKCLRWK